MKHPAIREKLAALALSPPLVCDYPKKGYALDVALAPDTLLEAVTLIDAEGFFIEAITGVDWLGEQVALRKEALATAAAEAKKRAEAATEAGEEPAAEKPDLPPVVPDTLEAVYDFNHYQGFCRLSLRVRTLRTEPAIPSIAAIYPGANWHERETHDFFGIVFTGHPCLEPLLLPEDADFHPLLKDFAR